MNGVHEPVHGRLRALVLSVAWLAGPWVAAIPGAAHANVTGTVLGWGRHLEGQTNVPAGLGRVRAIAANVHTVMLKRDGTVKTWGDNEYGQANVPVGLRGITTIANWAWTHGGAQARASSRCPAVAKASCQKRPRPRSAATSGGWCAAPQSSW